MDRTLRRIPPETVIAQLDALLAKAGADTTLVGGTIGFRVHGAAGPWVVDLSVAGGDWICGDNEAFEKATCRVLAFASVFAAIAFAPDMLPALLSSGELAVQGDRRRLVKLAHILDATSSPKTSPLSMRLAAASP